MNAVVFGVYGLVDPDTKKVMYIGKSYDIHRRFGDHLNYHNNHDSNRAKVRWIADLAARGSAPVLRVLRQLQGLPCPDYVALDVAERELIHEYKNHGEAEFNRAPGGRGQNATRDEWADLASQLAAAAQAIDDATRTAAHVGGAQAIDKLMATKNNVDRARIYFGKKLMSIFPEWTDLLEAFGIERCDMPRNRYLATETTK